MGAFYKNEDQTLYVKRDIGDSVALCQCVAQELGHAELSMNSEVSSRRDMAVSYTHLDVYKRQINGSFKQMHRLARLFCKQAKGILLVASVCVSLKGTASCYEVTFVKR